MSSDGRAHRDREAETIVAALGIDGASVQSAGHNGEIAVLTVAAAYHDPLFEDRRTEVVERLKSLGFHYVALALGPAG